MGYRNAILSIVSETTFNMPHSSVLYHRFTRVESGQMESNWIVSNRFRQRNVRVAARFSISIHSVFRVVVVSLFHKRGRGGGEGLGRLLRANADRGVRSRAGNIWAKDPEEDFREFKATVSAYTRMSKVFGTDYC